MAENRDDPVNDPVMKIDDYESSFEYYYSRINLFSKIKCGLSDFMPFAQ